MFLIDLFEFFAPKVYYNCGILHPCLNFHAKNIDFHSKIAFWTLKNTIFGRILGAKIQIVETFFPIKIVNFATKIQSNFLVRIFIALNFWKKKLTLEQCDLDHFLHARKKA